ncbi:MAG TPA: hypothetical protein VKK31_20805 [Thermoanaerobaculia bacterium]|nr:hypothetical protein [Thermoanaerobaculia bacterium]
MPERSKRDELGLREATLDLIAEYLQNPTSKEGAQAELAFRAAQAGERQAIAAERAAEASIRYTKYTFYIVLAAAITAGAAIIGLFQG